MKRGDKLTAAAGVAACAACCAPLVLGPLAAVGAAIVAGVGAAGATGAAAHPAPGWLLVVLAVVTLSAALGVAYGVAVLIRRSKQVRRRFTASPALISITDLLRTPDHGGAPDPAPHRSVPRRRSPACR